jgi:hypothetical protein
VWISFVACWSHQPTISLDRQLKHWKWPGSLLAIPICTAATRPEKPQLCPAYISTRPDPHWQLPNLSCSSTDGAVGQQANTALVTAVSSTLSLHTCPNTHPPGTDHCFRTPGTDHCFRTGLYATAEQAAVTCGCALALVLAVICTFSATLLSNLTGPACLPSRSSCTSLLHSIMVCTDVWFRPCPCCCWCLT